MTQFTDGVTLTTKVIAILRKAPVNGEDPRDCPVVWAEDLGPNIVTKTARHCMGAWCADPGGMVASNSYSKANNWYVGSISVGENNSGVNPNAATTAATADDTELNQELATTLKPLANPPRKNASDPFSAITDILDPEYTHIAWVAFYDTAEANFPIKEVGLWVSENGSPTTNPSGDMTPSSPGGLPSRGPLMSRKILATTIHKTPDFTLEFVWAWMF